MSELSEGPLTPSINDVTFDDRHNRGGQEDLSQLSEGPLTPSINDVSEGLLTLSVNDRYLDRSYPLKHLIGGQ